MGKNQHYVPRFLLRNFALPYSKRKAVELLDLQKGLFHSPAPIKTQCKRDYFYGKDQAMENLLRDLETLASRVIREAIASRSTPKFATPDWHTMVDFIAIQHGRTPAAVEEGNSFATAMFRDMLRSEMLRDKPKLTPAAIDKVRLVGRGGASSEVRDAADGSPKLFDLQDLLVINECDISFVLPDVGVVFHNEWARESRGWGVTGLCCHGLQILLPLSPNVLWMKYDPNVYRIPQNRTVVSARKADDILKINRLAVAHAERSVYFAGDTPTRTMLSQIGTGLRAPRSNTVRSGRYARADGGKELLVATYYELPNVPLDVPWMTLWPQAARIPVSQRVGKYRPTSESLPTYREHRDAKQSPFSDPEG